MSRLHLITSEGSILIASIVKTFDEYPMDIASIYRDYVAAGNYTSDTEQQHTNFVDYLCEEYQCTKYESDYTFIMEEEAYNEWEEQE